MITLYSYFRSSAAYRVRIALNLKGVEYQMEPVHLLRDGGEQKKADYRKLNPQQLVPTLVHDDHAITQSLAIIEYIDSLYPTPKLFPSTPLARAQVNSMAQLIACDTHPLNNLRVLGYLKNELAVSDDDRGEWYQHWVAESFSALEKTLQQQPQDSLFCYGHTPTIADCVLIPQVFNAERFACSMEDYPRIRQINQHCQTLEAFVNAHPSEQPDAE